MERDEVIEALQFSVAIKGIMIDQLSLVVRKLMSQDQKSALLISTSLISAELAEESPIAKSLCEDLDEWVAKMCEPL